MIQNRKRAKSFTIPDEMSEFMPNKIAEHTPKMEKTRLFEYIVCVYLVIFVEVFAVEYGTPRPVQTSVWLPLWTFLMSLC